MTDKSREEFEAWADNNRYSTKTDNIGYCHPETTRAWRTWQASRAAVVIELPEVDAEDRYRRAESFIRETGRASISALQRNFKVSYGSACRLMDKLVERGVVSPVDSEGRRSIAPEVKL